MLGGEAPATPSTSSPAASDEVEEALEPDSSVVAGFERAGVAAGLLRGGVFFAGVVLIA